MASPPVKALRSRLMPSWSLMGPVTSHSPSGRSSFWAVVGAWPASLRFSEAMALAMKKS